MRSPPTTNNYQPTINKKIPHEKQVREWEHFPADPFLLLFLVQDSLERFPSNLYICVAKDFHPSPGVSGYF